MQIKSSYFARFFVTAAALVVTLAICGVSGARVRRVAPSITSQPVSQSVTVGQAATFAAIANGSAPLRYQWRKNGADIAGATASSYTTPATASSDNGAQFVVVARNHVGSTTSNAATLTVTSAGSPGVTVTPSSLTFGNQDIVTTSAPLMVALQNSGTSNLNVSGITASPSQFAVAAAPVLPLTLGPGKSVNIGVTFAPTAQGAVSGTLTIATNASATPTTVSLSGAGVQPAPNPVSIATSSLPGGTQQQAYSATLTATGGAAPYGWSVISSTLPSGLSLGAVSGNITGTPTVSGSFPFTAQVKDAGGQTAQKAFSLAISPASTSNLPNFGHVVVVVEENTNYASVVGNSSMAYLNSLINQYGLATQYYANTHPSIGNYFMLTTGQILTNSDSQTPSSFPVSVDNVVRELINAGKTWKAYAESLPSVGYLGGNTTSGGGQYYVRHVPIAYLTDVQSSSTQRQNLVPFTQFAQDLAAGNLPNFSFITPNGCNDAHDCSLSTADNWLKNNIDPLLKDAAFQKDGLLVVVFDEAGNDNTNGGGRVGCVLISPAFSKKGYQSTTIYQHEDLLRLMLEGMGVTVFPGVSSNASDMKEFF